MKTFLYLFLIFYFSIMFTENLIINKFRFKFSVAAKSRCVCRFG